MMVSSCICSAPGTGSGVLLVPPDSAPEGALGVKSLTAGGADDGEQQLAQLLFSIGTLRLRIGNRQPVARPFRAVK